MTSILRALTLLVPLAALWGCEPANDTGDTDTTVDTGDTIDWTDWWSVVHTQLPYGWSGDHYVKPNEDNGTTDPYCQGSAECEAELDEYGTMEVSLRGDNFKCVAQIVWVDDVKDYHDVVDATQGWDAEGVCGLAPDGDYSGWNVDTEYHDWNGHDQVWLNFDGYYAVITNNTFQNADDADYTFYGTIADDLSWIEFHLAVGTGTLDGTYYLQ